MTRKQDNAKGKITAEELRKMLAEDRDLPKVLVEETLQQVLEGRSATSEQRGADH